MIRSRVTRHILVLGLSAACLLACCAVISFIRAGASGAVDKAPPPHYSLVCELPVAGARSIAFSDNGQAICAVDGGGGINVYSFSGERRYCKSLDGVTDIAVTDDAGCAVAFSKLNPADTKLRFLDSTGSQCWQMEVDGAVWSADARRTADGARFAVGTGQGYVYIIDIGESRRRYRRWRTEGAVVSIALSPDVEEVTFATWQKSVLARCSVRGARKWEVETHRSSLHYIDPLDTPERMLVRAVPNRPTDDAVYVLMDRSGDIVTRGALAAREHSRILAAPNGEYLCLHADELIRHKGKSMREQRAILMDAAGNVLCTKGSPFFQADPLLVTATGHVLLSNGRGQLFTLSPSGELQPAVKIAARVTRSVASRDALRVALVCGDGKIRVLDSTANDTAAALR